MTINRKRGLFLGVIIGVGCFSLSNILAGGLKVNNDKEISNRSIEAITTENVNNPEPSDYSGKFISFVDVSPAVLGAQAPIATATPELKPLDNNNF